MNQDNLIDLMREMKVFKGMNDQQLEDFKKIVDVAVVEKNRLVVKKGQRHDAMYLVSTGKLRVINKKGEDIATLEKGDCFGEMSLFDKRRRSADVVANVDSTLLRISAEGFRDITDNMPQVAMPFVLAICRIMAGRIRDII